MLYLSKFAPEVISGEYSFPISIIDRKLSLNPLHLYISSVFRIRFASVASAPATGEERAAAATAATHVSH